MSAIVFESRTESHVGNSSSSLRLRLTVDEREPNISIDPRTETDEDLVTRAKSGDQQAFVELCRRYDRVLKRRIHRIVQNHHDTEDVFQDCILRAYTNLAGFRGSCSFQSWITRIALNSSVTHLRKRRHLCSQTSMDLQTTDATRVRGWDIPDRSPNPEECYATCQASTILTRAVKRLPPALRQIVKQYHEDEAKLVDVANAIGITLAAAKARLFRARRLLRRRLENDFASVTD